MEQTNKNLQSLYRLSPSDSYLDEPNGRTLGAQVSAQAAAQLGRLALTSARADKFSSLNFTQNWNIPGFEQGQSAASDELATLSAAALEAYAYQEDYDLSPEDYASLMRVRHFVKTQDEARAQALGAPANEPTSANKPRYAIYRSGAVMPLRPATKEQPQGYSQPMSYGMTKGLAQSVGLERNLGTERYAQYINLQPTNNATTRITMSTSSVRAHALAAAHPEGLLVDAETGTVINADVSVAQVADDLPETLERLTPEHEIIANVEANALTAQLDAAQDATATPQGDAATVQDVTEQDAMAQDAAATPEHVAPSAKDNAATLRDNAVTAKTEAEVKTMTTDAKDDPAPQVVPALKSEPVRHDEVIASNEGVRIVRTIKQTFVPSPDAFVARHSMTRERWGEYGLKGVGGRPLTTSYPRPEDDYYVPTPSTMRPLTVAEAQAALDAARRRQAYGVENAEENGDQIANAVLVRNSTTRIVTNSRKAAADYEKSAALDAEIERLKQEQAPQQVDDGPATVISRHAVMQRPVKSAAELLAEAQAQIIAPIAAIPDAGWENALGRDYVEATTGVIASTAASSTKVEPSAAFMSADDNLAVEVNAYQDIKVNEPERPEPVSVEADLPDTVAPVEPEVVVPEEAQIAQEQPAAAPVVAATSVGAVEPVVEPVPVVETASVAEPEPVVAAAPIAEAAPVVEAAPVAELESAAEATSVEEEAPAQEVAPSEFDSMKGRRSRRNKTRARAKAAAAAALAEVNAADPQPAPVKAQAQPEAKVEAKAEPKREPQVKIEPPVEVKAQPKVEAKTEPPAKPQPAQAAAQPTAQPEAVSGEGAAHRRKRRRR